MVFKLQGGEFDYRTSLSVTLHGLMPTAIASLLSAGDHIVASKNLYGGAYNMMNLTLPRFGITTTFVDPRDPSAFEAAT